MRKLQFSALLGLSWLLAAACSSTTPSATSTPAAGAGAGAFSAGGSPISAGSGGSLSSPAGSAGTSAAGEDSAAGGQPDLSEAGAAGAANADEPAPDGWTLRWSDEFEGPAGQQIDTKKWKYSVGPANVNSELEYYTDRLENSALDGQGHLLITARKEAYKGRNYTSAKFTSAGLFQVKYGRLEARIQLPAGKGLWPAFWALGTNINSVGWPSCGEIDIMETMGSQLSINRGSLHGPGYSGGNPLTAQYHLPAGPDFSQAFHVFAAEWEENVVRFYVDNQLYETRTPKDLSGKTWAYNHEFYMIMNVAVGGQFPGPPDDSIFPRTELIDYVRVYSR